MIKNGAEGTTKRDRFIRACFLLLCCAVMVTVSVIIFQSKEGLFLDEYSSYGCANGTENGKNVPYSNDRVYSSEEITSLVRATYSVQENMRFRFDKVWENLNKNVHPPVFYAALHFVCSLTPGVFSIWQAAAVNIFFALIGLIFFQKTAAALSGSEWFGGILSLIWCATLGHYANIILLRDYVAAMTGGMMVFWEVYRFLKGHRRIPDLIKLGLASAFAVLSHYYCAVYLFFLCGTLVVILMFHRQWKGIGLVFATEICAAGLTLAIFPAMLTRVFGSKRGAESVSNLSRGDVSVFGKRLKDFADYMNQILFGGQAVWLLALAAALLILWLVLKKMDKLPKKEAGQREISLVELGLLVVPAVLFYVMICRIAAMDQARYLFPAMSVIYLCFSFVLLWLGGKVFDRRAAAAGVLLAIAVFSGLSWNAGKISYLYRGMNANIEKKLSPYQGIDAVQIWHTSANYMCVTSPQYSYYGTVTFYNKGKNSRLASIPSLQEGKDVMVILGKKASSSNPKTDEDYVRQLLELYPGYTAKKLGNLDKQSRFINYLFHKE